MSAVTGLHRLSIIAIAALLAAGCGASLQTDAPTSAATDAAATASPAAPPSAPARTAGPTSAPTPSSAPTAGPSEFRCRSYEAERDGSSFASVSARNGELWLWPEITSLVRADTGESLPLPPPPNDAWWAQFVIGGRDVRFQVGYGASYAWPLPREITLTSLEARLIPDEGPRIDLEARFEPHPDGAGTIAVVRLPDGAFRGTMKLTAEWRDECFVVSGHGSQYVIMDPPSAIEGCPDTRKAGFEGVEDLFEEPATVGPLQVGLVVRGQGKKVDLSVIDPLPPYVGFRAETPTTTASTGATIHVTIPNPDVIVHARVREKVIAFRRAPLIRWIEGGWIHGDEPEAEIVFRSPLVDLGDGQFSFTAPTEPGRYAVEAVFDYDAQCSYGTIGFVVGVDVE